VPEPVSGEALVRVSLAGICGTDLELVKGYYPFTGIPGHEFVGEIVQAPDRPDRVGERVVGEINVACNTCRFCLEGLSAHCENRKVTGILNRNGLFAEYACLPLSNLFTVPASVSDDAAVLVEPLAAALEIQEQVKIAPEDRVLVLGAGRLGQLIAQVLALTGCDLLVSARYGKQRDLLDTHRIAWIDEKVPERFFDVVVEATGSPDGFAAASRTVRPRGTIVLKSTYQRHLPFDVSTIVVNEITLVGSRCGPFGSALHLLQTGQVAPEALIEHAYPLGEVLAAFEQAALPGALKVLLRM
jgi:2-desacetyl-2-hydroxyethyl bacteriochlorophyllide A dehydrogenase